MALSDLENRVIGVAMKWEKTINSMTTEQLQREDFKERIKKGALYFHSELTEIFSKTIPLTKEVETNNKVGAKRFDSTYTELKQTYDAKQDLLESMMEEDFTITNYLTRKQEAILNSIGDETERKRRKRRETKDSPAAKKISTYEQSYILYKAGKSIEEIAKERGLTEGTIQGHLVPYINNGDIKLEDVIEEKKINIIKRIAKAVGRENGIKPIKEQCPSDITYNDINLVIKTTVP